MTIYFQHIIRTVTKIGASYKSYSTKYIHKSHVRPFIASYAFIENTWRLSRHTTFNILVSCVFKPKEWRIIPQREVVMLELMK